jgi:hypothetical protein
MAEPEALAVKLAGCARGIEYYYVRHVCEHLRSEFPALVSYARFVELTPQTLVPLMAYLQHCFGACTGIAFVDATALAVCRNQRIGQHKVFAGIAARGKTSMGWLYGFKLHLVANDCGELLARSPLNFVVSLLASLIAYCLQPKKPLLHLHRQVLLPAA